MAMNTPSLSGIMESASVHPITKGYLDCSTSSTPAVKGPAWGWHSPKGSWKCMAGASGSNQKAKEKEVCFALHSPSRNRSYEIRNHTRTFAPQDRFWHLEDRR